MFVIHVLAFSTIKLYVIGIIDIVTSVRQSICLLMCRPICLSHFELEAVVEPFVEQFLSLARLKNQFLHFEEI